MVGFVRVRGQGMHEVWVGGWGGEEELRWGNNPCPGFLGQKVEHVIFGKAGVEVIMFGSEDRAVVIVAGVVG